MKSPFPGMDPYLEQHWGDVHASLVISTRSALNRTLPPGLVARVEERVYVETGDVPARRVIPDVRVVERPASTLKAAPATSPVGVAEPVLLDLDDEPVTERFIEILEADGGRVVTAIEFISPANKLAGEGRKAYLQKRQEFFDSNANLVEIDLVRAGDWVSLLRPYRVPAPYRTAYHVCIRRSNRRKAELYPITMRDRLPILPIPLRHTDPDVALDLQLLIDEAYDSGRYADTDYQRPCDPPLEGEDAAWADGLLRAAGKR